MEAEGLLELMRVASGSDNERRAQASLTLQKMTYYIDNIQQFDNVLNACTTERPLLHLCLVALRDILNNRGVLLDESDIQKHMDYLLQVCSSMADNLASDPPILNMLSEAIAIGYRLIVERHVETFKQLFKFYNVSNSHNIILLNVMISIVHSFEKRLKHNSRNDMETLKKSCSRYLTYDYVDCAFKLLMIDDEKIVQYSLQLLIQCFQFNTEKPEERANEIKSKYRTFYETPTIPDRLFFLIRNLHQPINGLSLHLLFLYSNVTEKAWFHAKIPTPFNQYCKYITDNLNDLFENSPHVNDLINFLNNFIKLINLETFLKVEENLQFFISVFNFTMNKGTKEIIKFWGIVGSNSISLPESLIEQLPNIFEFYIKLILNDFENVCNEFYENYEESIHVLKDLWLTVSKCTSHAVNFLVTKFNEIIQQENLTNESFQQIIIFIRLIDAYSQCFKDHTKFLDINDIYRSFAILLNSVFDYILSTSPKIGILLNSFPEYVCKSEQVLILLAGTIKNNVLKQKMALINRLEEYLGKNRQDIYHLFVDRFMNDLNIFTQYPFILYQILKFVEEMCNPNISTTLSNYGKNNNLLYKLANREIIFNFENVEFPQLNKLLPMLYKIYTYNINNWPQFLACFDEEIQNIEPTNSAQIFILCRKLYGIFPSLTTENNIFMFYHWVFSHLNNFIIYIQSNSQIKEVIHAIIQLWLQVCIHNNKKFPQGSSFGIELFRANTQILLLLKNTCKDSEWLAMKIIHSCITGRYANFGIMNLYNDNSLQVVIDLFFNLLNNWIIGEDDKKLIKTTECIMGIVNIGCGMSIFGNQANAVLEFLIQNLLLRRIDVWGITCECLSCLMVFVMNAKKSLRPFLQQIIVLLDGLINLDFDIPKNQQKKGRNDDNLLKTTAFPLFYMWQYDRQALVNVLQEVINTFEPRFQEEVNEVFHKPFTAYPPGPKPFDDFYNNIKVFQSNIQRFPVQLSNIPTFAPIFHRNQPK